VEVTFGEKKFTVSALNWTQLDELQADIARINKLEGGFSDPENRAATQRVVLACVHRKHPEVSEEYIRTNLDLGNVKEAIAAVFGANGFKQSGEAAAATSATST